jgi:hypothetical protein
MMDGVFVWWRDSLLPLTYSALPRLQYTKARLGCQKKQLDLLVALPAIR